MEYKIMKLYTKQKRRVLIELKRQGILHIIHSK